MADPLARGPVLIDLSGAPALSPAEAAPVPDLDLPPSQLQTVALALSRRPSRLGRWFWGSFLSFFGFVLSLTAWDYLTGLLARNSVLGWVAVTLLGLFLAASLVVGLRELAAFARLRRLDTLRSQAEAAVLKADLGAARQVVTRLGGLYAGRPELAAGRAVVQRQQADQFDADGLLGLAETALLAPLDQAATREVEAAARRVALVTAFVPLALADVVTALIANLAMIRRVAEIYGGRSGTLGSWRLTRKVIAHLAATGALAVGDDLIHSVAGGSLLSKLSRRFGEGVVNGALTARVGLAAIEACRPLPFRAEARPGTGALVSRALAGLFGRDARGA